MNENDIFSVSDTGIEKGSELLRVDSICELFVLIQYKMTSK